MRFPQLDRVVRGTFVRAARSSLGHARKGGEAGRTCEILRAIDGQDCPDGLLVSNKVVEQLEVFPHLCGPIGGHEWRGYGARNGKHSLVP